MFQKMQRLRQCASSNFSFTYLSHKITFMFNFKIVIRKYVYKTKSESKSISKGESIIFKYNYNVST